MPAGVTGPIGVRKVTFAKYSYPTTESVNKFLTDNKWEGYVITDKDDHFEAAGEGVTDEMFTDVQRTLLAKDVFSFAGKVVAGTVEATTTATATVIKGKDNAKKYDDYDAWRADNTDLFSTIAAGLAQSPTPPGTWELNWAMLYTMTNLLKAGGATREQLAKVGADFGGLIHDIHTLLSGFTDTKQAAAFLELPPESVVKSALSTDSKSTTQKEANVPNPDDAKNTTEADPKAEAAKTETSANPAPTDAAPKAETTTDASGMDTLVASIAGISKSIGELAQTVAGIASTTTTLAGRLDAVEKANIETGTKLTEVAKAVTADNNRTPAPKAETTTDTTASTAPAKPAVKSVDDRFHNNFLGIG